MASIDPYYGISRAGFLVNRVIFGEAYRRADLILTQARFYVDKLRRLYGINPGRVTYLPNPVRIPESSTIAKSGEPLIYYLARMDPQKRYWLFFELARQFPEYKFVAMGKPSILYEGRYQRVIGRYRGLRNLDIKGFVGRKNMKYLTSAGYSSYQA